MWTIRRRSTSTAGRCCGRSWTDVRRAHASAWGPEDPLRPQSALPLGRARDLLESHDRPLEPGDHYCRPPHTTRPSDLDGGGVANPQAGHDRAEVEIGRAHV